MEPLLSKGKMEHKTSAQADSSPAPALPLRQEKGCREALFASHCTLRDLYTTRLLFRLGSSSNKGFYKHENASK